MNLADHLTAATRLGILISHWEERSPKKVEGFLNLWAAEHIDMDSCSINGIMRRETYAVKNK